MNVIKCYDMYTGLVHLVSNEMKLGVNGFGNASNSWSREHTHMNTDTDV